MKNTYETEQLLGESVILDLVTGILDWKLVGNSLILTCKLERFKPRLYDSYGTVYENLYLPAACAGTAAVQIDFCTNEIFRFRFSPGDTVLETNIPSLDVSGKTKNTPMVVGIFDQPVDLQCTDLGAMLQIETSSLVLQLDKKPWQLRVYSVSKVKPGSEIFCTRSTEIPMVQPDRQIDFDPTWNFYTRYAYPLGVARRMGEDDQVFDSFDMAHNEHFYGFGERYLALDKRGQKLHLWNEEVYSNTSTGTYKSIPFFMSSRGYGIFINTALPVTARMGDLTGAAYSLILDRTTAFDYYFIYGPEYKQILPRYTDITGKPALPPKWSFGHWMSRITYASQEEVEKVAVELRQHRIPTDVIHIDTGWFRKMGNSDLLFDPDRFPDPAGMCARLKEMGFRVTLWQTPNTAFGNALYNELALMNGMVRREDGKIFNRAGYDEDCGLIDYSNPEVVAFMKQKFKDLFALGIAAIKVDFGEGGPIDGVYHGYPPEAMHNLYALLYNQAVFEATEEYFGNGNGVIWARSTWAGSQQYPVHWSGDGAATWRDLPCTLRSGLGFGLSGFVFWSHDIGGFIGNAAPELYARWVQVGAFSSHSRAHGEAPREPWCYGQEVEKIYRKYMELRYRLLPYIYSQSVSAVNKSLPVMRALVVDYQDDPTVATIEDEYLFGDDILVAPIMDPSNCRMVYLPHGTWVDYWSKKPIEGGKWLQVEAPLEILPLWIRAGAVIPMGPVQQYVDEKSLDPLTLEFYLPVAAGGTIIHDQHHPNIQIVYRREGDQLNIDVTPGSGTVEVILYGARARSAVSNGRVVPLLEHDFGQKAVLEQGTAGLTLFF
jgi:alpha-D-xyloside xylohydrolase